MSKTTPDSGVALELAPGLRRVIAPNPSPMTYWGTNTYLLGKDSVAVIDPGPSLPEHLDAILNAVGGGTVSHIIVTHSHLDHSPLAKDLADRTGASVYSFGDSDAGQSDTMRSLAAVGLTGGGEGVDRDFHPDVTLEDQKVLRSKEWTIRAHHTPGHMGNHLALEWKNTVFTGDLVMGWASTMVSPPDGDLGDFLASCQKLKDLQAELLFPAHGAPISDPNGRIDWLVDHRNQRTKQIEDLLALGSSDVESLTTQIYQDAAPGLLFAASRNVFAHIIDLHQKGRVSAHPKLGPKAVYTLI